MKKRFLPTVILLVGFSSVKAQFDTQLSNYWAAVAYFNPAYAGQSGNLEATLMSRMQWVGVSGAPRTTILTAGMPYRLLGKTHGVGALMYSDRIGLFATTAWYGQYAWKKKLFGGDFSVGLQGGSIAQSFDGTKTYIPQNNNYHSAEDEEAIPVGAVSGNGIDISLGMFYAKKKWFAGLSVNHLLSPHIDLNENYVFEIPRSYYFIGGYNIQLSSPLLELQSTMLLKTMQMSSYAVTPDSLTEKIKGHTLKAMLHNSQVDISVRMVYDKKIWGGLSWRYGDAIVLLVGGKFKMIEAGYAYDFPISRIIKTTTGSHELFIRYSMDLNMKKKGKYKHKSVRIL